MALHPTSRLAAAGLAAALALAGLGAAGLPGPWGGLDWTGAAFFVLLAAFLLPATASLNLTGLALAGRPAPAAGRMRLILPLSILGAVLGGIGHLLQPSGAFAIAAFAGVVILAAAAALQSAAVLPTTPRRGEDIVDEARDPLTKGDGASLKHVRFAHVFLPLGMALLAAAYAPGVAGLGGDWDGRLRLAGLHVLLLGYGALTLYGVGHVVVPRLSGVPAIAAGAIQGELHSTLAGVTLAAAGFLANVRGLVVAGGAFAFIGVFTYMGVLGANIMKRKSATQSVTREFVYVPWAFAGVFWLSAGILGGLFLNALPGLVGKGVLDARTAYGIRFAHAWGLLVGAFAQLWVGFLLRTEAAVAGTAPATFATTRWAFWGLNLGLTLLLAGAFRAGPPDLVPALGALVAAAAVAGSFKTLSGYGRRQGEGT